MSPVGDIIRKKRAERGWTQEQLAKAAGVSQQLIWKLETGKALETRKLVLIAKAFGQSVDEFLGNSQPAPVRAAAAAWPFAIPYARFARLPELARAKIEGAVEQMIRGYESDGTKSPPKPHKRRRAA